MPSVRRAVVAVAVVLGALVLPTNVAGHALLQSSDPAAGATLGSPPATVTLRFGERPDPRLSRIRVIDAAGAEHATGAVEAVADDSLALRIGVGPIGDGVYTVSWRTVSAVDGHAAAGAFAFGVGVSPPPPGQGPGAGAAAAGPTPASTIGRWLLYAGLIVLFGAGFIASAIVSETRRRLESLAIVGWLGAAAGTLVVVAGQWDAAQADIGTILGTSVGIAGVARGVALAIAALPLLLAVRAGEGRRRVLLGLAGACASLAMLVDVASGHAASGQGWLVNVAAQWLHVTAVGVWLGGLLALLVSLRGEASDARARAVRRFSTVAGFALLVVALTGVIRAIAEIGTVDALLSTDFGRIVIAKTLLLVVLAGFGAFNRFVSVPRAVATLRWLRRVGTTEVATAALVVALTAVLVDLAPPISVGPGQAAAVAPIVTTGNDFGTSVRLRLVATPGAAGVNEFSVVATDFDSGAPVEAPALSLRFRLLSGTDIGQSTLDLAPAGDGRFTGAGTNLSIDGVWAITATIGAAAGSVEVPLIAATVIPAQLVDVNASPGVPTIYSVHTANGGTVQVYLDPEQPGKGLLHATFFDAAGVELPIGTATMAIAPASGTPALLEPRQLEPGHFVAAMTAVAGPLGVDVVGMDPAGGPIHVHLTLPVPP